MSLVHEPDFLPEHAIFFVADLKRTNIALREAPPMGQFVLFLAACFLTAHNVKQSSQKTQNKIAAVDKHKVWGEVQNISAFKQ